MFQTTRAVLAVTIFLGSLASIAPADVKLAGIFGDHMVLQQGATVPVWGEAAPGERVSVTAGNSSAATTAGPDGRWRVDLDPLQPSDQAIQLTASGANKLTLTDVLIGDVWLAAGQSNMQYSLKNADDAKDALAKADQPAIRLCQIGVKTSLEPLADRSVHWTICTPETAAKFSAVAYFFGSDVHAATRAPVGLIGAYVSGTPAQSWTNLDALRAEPALQHYVDEVNAGRSPATAASKPSEVSAGTPTSLFNGMIAPLIPLRIKGVIWYQGESNTGQFAEYRTLFPAMITGWRKQWGQDRLPFFFVQLPGFGRRSENVGVSNWAFLREAQAGALSLPETGMAVTLDLSQPRMILHPKNKSEVGHRLALQAQKIVYGQDVPSFGPVFDSEKTEGGRVRIHFKNTEGGLQALVPAAEGSPRATTKMSEASSLKGFTIAGADHHFIRAEATIDGDEVVVASPLVTSPQAVRYGWEDNPEVNLCNGDALPAVPFRTDNWPQ